VVSPLPDIQAQEDAYLFVLVQAVLLNGARGAGLGVGIVRASTLCRPATRVLPGVALGGTVVGPLISVSNGAFRARWHHPPGHRFDRGGTSHAGPGGQRPSCRTAETITGGGTE
jgi:hypothetical protein